MASGVMMSMDDFSHGSHAGLLVTSCEFRVFPEEAPIENLKVANQLVTPYPGFLESQAWCLVDSQ